MSLLQTTSIKSPSFAVYDTPQSQPVPLAVAAATVLSTDTTATATTTHSSPYIHQHHHHYNQQQQQCHQQEQSKSDNNNNNQHSTASAPVSRWLPDSSTFHLASYMPTSKTRPVHLVAQNYCLQHKSYYAFSWCPACGTLI
ncbi:hypothetical protein K492DRAFT_178685 [Lichtheimia hyalospora FSU 10163]|nr:hypothetical protein K492DRAFT_178685 [Lichtheimia hyalospora FSU 10163]